MATVADLKAQVSALTASIQNLPKPVATQADLDGLSSDLAAAQAAADALKS